MLGFIKRLDNFGYTPQFTISGQPQFKTVAGGVIFLLFIIFALYYFSSELAKFIISIDLVESSRTALLQSGNFFVSNRDMYFGIGLVDGGLNSLNFSDYDYLKFNLLISTTLADGTKTESPISLEPCDLFFFYGKNDVKLMSKETINRLTYKLKNYLCPPYYASYQLLSSEFAGDNQFVQFDITLASNDSALLRRAEAHLYDNRPMAEFIYKNVFIDTNNKGSPYTSSIGSMETQLDYDLGRKAELKIDPFELMDDYNLFGGSKYVPFETDISTQANYTVFQMGAVRDTLGHYSDREKPLASNNYQSYLSLYRVRLSISGSKVVTYRTFPKFTTFLAAVSAILSNLLLILTMVMFNYNSIQGSNNMIHKLYSFNSLKSMENFNLDVKKFLGTEIDELKKKDIKEAKIEERKKKRKMINVEKLDPTMNIQTDENMLQISAVVNRKRYRVHEILSSLIEDNISFSFADFIKNTFCVERTSRHFYRNAIENLSNSMDIEKYLKFQLEFNLVKEILFDSNQQLCFEIISTLVNFKNLFDQAEEEEMVLSGTYSESGFQRFFDNMSVLFKRQDLIDKKIIGFLRTKLDHSL